MRDLTPGLYQARINYILPASFRNHYRDRLEEGYFTQFQVIEHGTSEIFSEVTSARPHHKSTLARLFGPLLKDRGIPLASFERMKESLLGALVGLKVTRGRKGAVFQLLPLNKNQRGEVAVGGEHERQAA